MKWVTRERPKIDRIACPWLIARFIADAPQFLYVPSNQVLPVAQAENAIPYDVPGIEPSHVGELCSFDAFLKKYTLQTPGLERLARDRSGRGYVATGIDAPVGRAIRALVGTFAYLR